MSKFEKSNINRAADRQDQQANQLAKDYSCCLSGTVETYIESLYKSEELFQIVRNEIDKQDVEQYREAI